MLINRTELFSHPNDEDKASVVLDFDFCQHEITKTNNVLVLLSLFDSVALSSKMIGSCWRCESLKTAHKLRWFWSFHDICCHHGKHWLSSDFLPLRETRLCRVFYLYKPLGSVYLTSPWMRGVAPMAFCKARTSSEGPVMRDVPVSTMASQPLLHRLSWLPTVILTHTCTHTSHGWSTDRYLQPSLIVLYLIVNHSQLEKL